MTVDDDEWALIFGESGNGIGTGRGEETGDALGDELLELAEGESSGSKLRSLADVEESLLMHGRRSQAFTYTNLFGAGAAAIQRASGEPAAMTDDELGIVRDKQHSAGLLLGDETPDEEHGARNEAEMANALEAGRKTWIDHQRQKARTERSPEPTLTKRMMGDSLDYLSDEEPAGDGEERAAKRPRRSSTRSASRHAQGVIDAAAVKRLYIIEKAKLRMARDQNVRMRAQLAAFREMERVEMLEKRRILEKTLEAILGRDVSAIFSPPPSPPAT